MKKQTDYSPLPSPLFSSPSLSSIELDRQLRCLYEALNTESKHLFDRAFTLLWNKIMGYNAMLKSSGVLYFYHSLAEARNNAGISDQQLILLTLLNQLTEQGQKTIIASSLVKHHCPGYLTPAKFNLILSSLRKRGYIRRSCYDPANPHYSSSRGRTLIYLSITPAGLAIIKDINKAISWALFHTVAKDVSTGHRKAPSKR